MKLGAAATPDAVVAIANEAGFVIFADDLKNAQRRDLMRLEVLLTFF